MTLIDRVLRATKSPWFRLLAFVALGGLAVASLMPGDAGLPRTRLPGPVEHFLAYCAVAAIIGTAFRNLVSLRTLLVAMIVYAGVLEFAQQWAPGREASVIDFLASTAGTVAGLSAAACLLWARGRYRRI
jgi:VanZ family protein